MTDLIHLDGRAVALLVEEQARALRNPPRTVDDLLGSLEAAGLDLTVKLLRSTRF